MLCYVSWNLEACVFLRSWCDFSNRVWSFRRPSCYRGPWRTCCSFREEPCHKRNVPTFFFWKWEYDIYVVACYYQLQSSGGARRDLEDTDHPLRHPEFRYKTEFQSHDPEVLSFHYSLLLIRCVLYLLFAVFWYVILVYQFDYLKSLEIEEKINKIRWCQTANGALFLLSTNDKTIKFWKVSTSFVYLLASEWHNVCFWKRRVYNDKSDKFNSQSWECWNMNALACLLGLLTIYRW